MIEIFSIFLQIFIFLVVFSFPFNSNLLNNYFKNYDYNFSVIDSHIINILFFLYVCLFISFLNLDIEVFFKIYLALSLIFLFSFNRKIIFSNKKILVFCFFLLIVISIFFFIAQNIRLEWDGANHWLEKARVIYNKEKISNLANVQVHPHYPHLGSYVWALFWKNSFLEFEYFGRLFFVYLYLISLFLVFKFLNLKKIFINILIILFLILITFEPYYFAGYQEYLIFSILIIAANYISKINFDKKPNLKIIIFIILILYLMLWFKDEGALYYFLFSITLVLVLNFSNFEKFCLIFLIIFLFFIQYFLQKNLIGIFDFPQKPSISLIIYDIKNLDIFFSKISKILIHFIIAFFKHPLWLLIFFSIIFNYFFNKNFKKLEKYFIICLFLNLCLFGAMFFTFRNFDAMLQVSLDRLLFQSSGFYLFMILISLLKKNFINK